MPERKLLFNHIPKTGGVTLRVILNRVHGENNIFLIKSTDIRGSLKLFRHLSSEQREKFAVIAGHGAELFLPFMDDDPYRITILREPVALFLSQYYYLKNTRNAGFYDELRGMESLDEYLDFAITNGQDNLLTRYLSGSVQFLADPGVPVPDMQNEGNDLLKLAIHNLHEYDAVLDLDDFDAGVYALATLLNWKKIPLYRPQNRNRKNPGTAVLPERVTGMLKDALKYDIDLYQEFTRSNLSSGKKVIKSSLNFKLFHLRQAGIRFLM